MKYIIKDKVYSFTKEDLDYLFIGKGEEGSCYRIRNYRDDFVMKIFHSNPEKKVLDEETCKTLTEIDMDKFILPNELVYDEDGKYIGFTTKYVSFKKPKIRNLKIGKVIDEFCKLEKEVGILSENNVFIDDLDYYNTIFSDGIYICDPGSFSLAENQNQERFANYYNRKRITEYEIEEIIFNLFKLGIREKDRLNKIFSNLDEFLSDYLAFIVSDREEKAQEYFKELVKI